MSGTARIEVNEQSIDLPLVVGSEGETGIDIGKLRAQTKAITLDPGFVNTGSCESGITFLNGEKGILHIRLKCLLKSRTFLKLVIC
jgi:citrate synthase